MNHLQITNMLEGLSLTDLRQLQTAISAKQASSAPGLRVGMKCTVDHHKVVGMTGKIIKVNRTRCKVEFDGNRYTVPMSMISLA